MSLSGHFSSKYIQQDKAKRDYKTFEDFPSKLLRHPDGTYGQYKGGKLMPGTHTGTVESNKKPKKDVAAGESKNYKPTETSTIVQKTKGDDEKAGEAETGLRTRKKFDPNARAYKL